MSLKKSLRTILTCMVLQVGVLSGVPMRPEQVRELMFQLGTPKVAHTSPDERHSSKDPSAEGEGDLPE